jgi:uncharacterized membrane protein
MSAIQPPAEPDASTLPTTRHLAHLHIPRLVLSKHMRGQGILDKLAQVVSEVVGSMYVFVLVTTGIVVWLFAGNVIGFDKSPWPLLLTVLNLPQLSIMISLQVSANVAQKANDARAVADHETITALHALAKHHLSVLEGQTQLLEGQQQILDLLKTKLGC